MPQHASAVTDSVIEGVAARQSQPLDAVYPILYLDAIETVDPKTQVQLCIIHVSAAFSVHPPSATSSATTDRVRWVLVRQKGTE
jgi:transposase-like protein